MNSIEQHIVILFSARLEISTVFAESGSGNFFNNMLDQPLINISWFRWGPQKQTYPICWLLRSFYWRLLIYMRESGDLNYHGVLKILKLNSTHGIKKISIKYVVLWRGLCFFCYPSAGKKNQMPQLTSKSIQISSVTSGSWPE